MIFIIAIWLIYDDTFQNGKGMQNSNNAYMLVYTSVTALNAIRVKSDEEIVIIESTGAGNRISGISGISGNSSTPSKNKKTPATAKTTPSAKVTPTPATPATRKSESNANAVKLEDGPLPIYLKAFIQEDRRLLEDELQEHILMKQTKHKEQVSLKTKMRSIYERLPPITDPDPETEGGNEEEKGSKKGGSEAGNPKYAFLPMEWLVRYFSNPTSPPSIDMAPCMCPHGSLDLNKIQDVKVMKFIF